MTFPFEVPDIRGLHDLRYHSCSKLGFHALGNLELDDCCLHLHYLISTVERCDEHENGFEAVR